MEDPRTAGVGATAGRTTAPNRLLVVDDEFALRQWFTDVLAGSGYQVETSEDGETAWETLQARDYDLLITDNNMPRVSGLELIKMLRSKDMALPVILISGAMPTQELKRYRYLQVAATLLKPFTAEQLLQTVRTVLSQSGRTRDHLEPDAIWKSPASVHSLPSVMNFNGLEAKFHNLRYRGNPQ